MADPKTKDNDTTDRTEDQGGSPEEAAREMDRDRDRERDREERNRERERADDETERLFRAMRSHELRVMLGKEEMGKWDLSNFEPMQRSNLAGQLVRYGNGVINKGGGVKH